MADCADQAITLLTYKRALIGRYIGRGEIRRAVAVTFPLQDMNAAQEAFLAKKHIGKIGIDVAA